MNQYIIDTKFAVETLIVAIYKEEIELEGLKENISSLLAKYSYFQADFSSSEMNEDFDEFQVQSKFANMAKAKEQGALVQREIDSLYVSVVNKKTSIESLSMSLLQIAKQGISTVHNTLIACPNGRSIRGENLKNVIWQARNQSIHCEEGNPHPAVRQCFSNLTRDFGDKFDIMNNPMANKSKEVVDLLAWKQYEKYELDIISLIG